MPLSLRALFDKPFSIPVMPMQHSSSHELLENIWEVVDHGVESILKV